MTQTSKWLLRELNPNAKARLFCFPFAGTGASAYRFWPETTENFEICPIQLPGRENRSREVQHDEVGDLTKDLLDDLLPYLDRPYMFFGHCMGALVAYDLILKIMQRNVRIPDHFYVSASRTPCSEHRGPVHVGMSNDELEIHLRQNTSSLIDPSLLSILMPHAIQLLRKDLTICDKYQPPVQKISCPITTFAWTNDEGMPLNELKGWREYSDSKEYLLGGNHFSVQSSSNILLPIIGAEQSEKKHHKSIII